MALNGVVATLPTNIGGGVVKSNRRINGRDYRRGDELSAEEIMAIPQVNRRSMVEKGIIEVWATKAAKVAVPEPLQRHVAQVGFGRHMKFDVIEGRKINDKPLTREEAYALAGIEPKAEAAD